MRTHQTSASRLRAVAGGPEPAGAVPDAPSAEATRVTTTPPEGAEVAARLREHAARRASAVYAAAHGHPTEHSGFSAPGHSGARRWALSLRLAMVVLLVVVALGGVVGVVALRGGSEPVDTVAPLDRSPGVERPASGTGDTARSDASTRSASDEPAEPGSGAQAGTASGDSAGSREPPADGAVASVSPSVVVHVVGRVAKPGLVTLTSDARVADAIAAAGGQTPEADLAAVNLARPVVDGEQILVPAPGEAAPSPPATPGAAASTTGTGGASPGVVDLNSADVAALDALPGIGPVLAERIVAWRTDNGPFTSLDELGEVRGIGPAVLDTLRDLVRV